MVLWATPFAAAARSSRPRSGLVIDLEERIGDCFERSLNGRSPAYDSPEMRDMIAYMSWLSRDIPVGREVTGQGMPRLDPLNPGHCCRPRRLQGHLRPLPRR